MATGLDLLMHSHPDCGFVIVFLDVASDSAGPTFGLRAPKEV